MLKETDGVCITLAGLRDGSISVVENIATPTKQAIYKCSPTSQVFSLPLLYFAAALPSITECINLTLI